MKAHTHTHTARPLHTHFLCEEHLTPDLIESQIKGSFWLWFTEESWPRRFNYSVSITTHTLSSRAGFIWAGVMEVKEGKWTETDGKTYKGRKEDKTMKAEEWSILLVFAHKTHFKKMTAYQITPHTTSNGLSRLFNQSFSTFCLCLLSNSPSPFLLLPSLTPSFLSLITLTTQREDDTKARHLYLSRRLRPPKIRNSPLIWNKWPSSGKPKPPDSAAWFIKGAWSRKLVQLQQKLKLCPHATPNWRWGLKSTILTEPLTEINK